METPSALDEARVVVAGATALGRAPDADVVARLVCGRVRPDGGVSDPGFSEECAVAAAAALLRWANPRSPALDRLGRWMELRAFERPPAHLELLAWLTSGLAATGRRYPDPAGARAMLDGCARRLPPRRRGGGGFARATLMGIATLEYTYLAARTAVLLGPHAVDSSPWREPYAW